jgi:transposase
MPRPVALRPRRDRRWPHLDVGGMRVELRYDVQRADCMRCGVRAPSLCVMPVRARSAFDAFLAGTAQLEATTVYAFERRRRNSRRSARPHV